MSELWSPTTGEQEEGYYLAYREENETRYRQWCVENQMDPESTASAVGFEDDVARHNEASAD